MPNSSGAPLGFPDRDAVPTHAPADYQCPFCRFVHGNETPANTRADIVHEDDGILAFVAPRWWPNNSGNVIVIPRRHYENVYDIPDEVLARIMIVGKRIALAMKAVYRCGGISFRQHNEPEGGQDVFHFHLHVFPRYAGDELYQRTDDYRFAAADERRVYADRLRSYFERHELHVSSRGTRDLVHSAPADEIPRSSG